VKRFALAFAVFFSSVSVLPGLLRAAELNRDALIELTLRQAGELKGAAIQIDGLGSVSRPRFVSADRNLLTVELNGSAQPMPWKIVSSGDLVALAAQAARGTDDLLLVARSAQEQGLGGLAERLLDKALENDAAAAARVEELRASWKPKEPPKVQIATVSKPAVPKAFAPAGPWANVGPGGGGTMYTPTINPLNPKMALITCDMSGTYLTVDGGRRWRVIPHLRYGHGTAFSTSDPNVIFVGAADKLYRSPDAGLTWQGVTADRQYPTCACVDVLVDPDDGRFVWAAFGRIGEAHAEINPGNRLLVEASQDGGLKFKNASKGLPTGPGLVCRLAVDQATPLGNRTVYAATSVGFYRSRDGGFTWEKPAARGLDATSLRQVVTLFDKAAKKTTLLVSARPEGLWRSEDGGDTFQPSGSGLGTDATGKGFTLEALATATNDPLTAYAVGSAFAKSIDGGRTWKKPFAEARKQAGWLAVFKPWSHDGGRGVGCNPLDSKQVWFTGDMQFFASEDGGASFTELNSHPMPDGTPRWSYVEQFHKTPPKAPFFYDGGGLEVTYCYQVIPDPHREKVFYACYADIGTFRTEDGGASWTYNAGIWNQGIRSEWRNSCYEIYADRKVPGRLWGGFSGLHNLPQPDPASAGKYFNGGLAVSNDGGANWTPLEKSGLPDRPCTSVLQDRRDGSLVVALYGAGIFRSKDEGRSFQPFGAGLPADPLAWRLKQTPDGTIFLGCSLGKPGGLWRLEPGKETWTRCDTVKPFADVRDIAVLEGEKEDSRSVVVAAGGESGGIFASSDGGTTWRQVLSGSFTCVDVSVDRRVWCAGSRGGLQRSVDGGLTWKPVAEFPFPFVTDVTINPRNAGEIWVGTAGCGVFRGF